MEDKKITNELIDFINNSPTSYQVVLNTKQMLKKAGFQELHEQQKFVLEKGKGYFVERNGSALIAFKLPETDYNGYSIISSHSDSPSFKLKVNPDMHSNGYTVLNVESYGGMIVSPWFDRPLSIAGRVSVDTKDGIEERSLVFDRDFVSIVNVAIHLNRDINKGVEHKIQKEMLPLFSMNKDVKFEELIAKKLEVKTEQILDWDLYLYNRMEGSIWGANDEFFSVPRMDDQQCAYSSIKALINSELNSKVNLIAILDNEEVGSMSRQGALSDFLANTIKRIDFCTGKDFEEQKICQSNSFMLSADNGHAVHPNYASLSDPVNKPVLNGGVLIKHAGNQKYTSDSYSSARLKKIFREEGIKYQEFVNNSNIPGGSTLGNLSNSHYSIPSVDIGIAQLAMHSPYETGGVSDTLWLIKGMKAFFNKIGK